MQVMEKARIKAELDFEVVFSLRVSLAVVFEILI